MSYAIPTGGLFAAAAAQQSFVAGKVLQQEGGDWELADDKFSELDTSYGPVNFLIR